MTDRFTIRPARTADLGTITDNLVDGLSTYRGWTPAAWNPPASTEMLLGLLQRFARDGSWAHVAFSGPRPPATSCSAPTATRPACRWRRSPC